MKIATEMKFKLPCLMALVFVASLLAGCTSFILPKSNVSTDSRGTGIGQPSLATIIVYRNEPLGIDETVDVELDGILAGRTSRRNYFVLVVPPGKHILVSKTGNPYSLTVSAEAEHRYFVRQKVENCQTKKCEGTASELELVDIETANNETNKDDIMESQRIPPRTRIGEGEGVVVMLNTYRYCKNAKTKVCKSQESSSRELQLETCIAAGITKSLPNLKFVPANDFRSVAFPGKGYMDSVRDPEATLTELSTADFQKRIAGFNLRYLFILDSLTNDSESEFQYAAAGISMGLGQDWTRDTSLTATTLDVHSIRLASKITSGAYGKGSSGIFTIFLVPVMPMWTIPEVESRACADLGPRLAEFIAGKDELVPHALAIPTFAKLIVNTNSNFQTSILDSISVLKQVQEHILAWPDKKLIDVSVATDIGSSLQTAIDALKNGDSELAIATLGAVRHEIEAKTEDSDESHVLVESAEFDLKYVVQELGSYATDHDVHE